MWPYFFEYYIINVLSRLAGYEGQKLEMLNSGLVIDFIKACEMETVRIHKGT